MEAVVIGASTGGPRVLYDLITQLPKDLNTPVFVVQHMPAGFTKAFAERINKNSQLNVVEARDGEVIQANTVYIAPGGYHMMAVDSRIKLDLSPTIHGVRPAVDKLFNTAAELYKGKLLACILTGMGKDGADGVRNIKSRGGYILAQDEYTSTVYGMPKAAYETGCVDKVLPENKIADEIIRAVKRV
jgi:two-component system chemotaxis response regulator CheB